MNVRATLIRIVVRVRCPCPLNLFDTKNLAAPSHVVSPLLAPSQLHPPNRTMIVVNCASVAPSVNCKRCYFSSLNTAHELESEHLFAGKECRYKVPVRDSGVKNTHDPCLRNNLYAPLFAEVKDTSDPHLSSSVSTLTGCRPTGCNRTPGGGLLLTVSIAKSEQPFAELIIKGKHPLAELVIKGEHLFAKADAAGADQKGHPNDGI